MKIVEVKQRSPEWYTWRSRGITATDSVVILDRSPYKTRWRLWAEKTGLVEPEDLSRNPNVRRGNRLEDEARQKFEQKHGVVLLPVCVESEEDALFLASLDGVTPDGKPVEFKCPSDKTFDEVGKDGKMSDAFKMYHTQVLHQLFVTGADMGYLVFYRQMGGGPQMIELQVKRDDRTIEEIVREGKAFHELIRSGKEPCKDPNKDLFVPYEVQRGRWAVLARQRYRIDRELAQLEARVKDLKKALKENEAGLVSLIDAESFLHADYGGVKITRYIQQGSVDYPRLLKDELPELNQDDLDRYRKKPSSRVRISVTSEAESFALPGFRIVGTGEEIASPDARPSFAW